MGSLVMPMVRAKTFVDPPGSTPRAQSVPASPLAASLRVPSPPSTTTASVPVAAAPWASRVAWPRRLVSATVTSWSAASDFWITTRARAVTDEAEALTIRSSRTRAAQASEPGGSGCLGERPQLRHAAGEQPGHLHLGDAEAAGDLRLGQTLEEAQLHDLPLPAAAAGSSRGSRVARSSARASSASSCPSRSPRASGGIGVGIGGVEGGEPVGLAGFQSLENVLLGGLDLGGQLGDVG